VIGTTNRPDLIDPALLRPGRFDYQVEVGLPSAPERSQIFAIHLRALPQTQGVDIDVLVAKTEGFSGAEIAEVCRLAALFALREVNFAQENPVSQEHLLSALLESEEKRGRDGSTRFSKRVGFVTS
jgi:transitional endoplasmic reticulum ATPase